jgi:hypothetical protein
MTSETESELIAAFDSGYCSLAEPDLKKTTTLDRSRLEWAAATDQEREIFKTEIQPGFFRV